MPRLMALTVVALIGPRLVAADPASSADERAAAARAKQQALYELDHEEHTDLAHKRHVGHLELLTGLALVVVGGGLIAIAPRDSTAIALGGGVAIAGACTLAVGAIMTARGADPNPVVPPPPPLETRATTVYGAAYAWRF